MSRSKGDPTRVDAELAAQAFAEARGQTSTLGGAIQLGWTLYICAGFNQKRNPWPLGNLHDFASWCETVASTSTIPTNGPTGAN